MSRVTRKRSKRSLIVPRGVWLMLTVPLFAFQASKGELEISRQQNRSLLFTSHGLTWMAVLKDTVMSLRASPDVCVDDFLLRPLGSVPDEMNQSDTSGACLRSLAWQDPLTGRDRTIRIDSTGVDATVRPSDAISGMGNERHQLELIDNGTYVGPSGWFRFTGALILAVCATFLFLLFSITLCISIALTRRRKSSSRVPLTSSRIVHSTSRSRVYRAPDYAEDSLLPRIRKVKPEDETQSSGTEPVSTENGESLFQHDGNTCRSLVPEEGETEVMDPMATSAMQLARNWFLYRNRGDRLRQRTHVGHQPLITPPIIPYPPASPLTATGSSPCAPLKHPADKAAVSAFVDNQLQPVPRETKPTAASHTNFRHSLVLSVDDHDQLVILPSTQSVSSSMHRNPTPLIDSSIHEVEENGSDVDENFHAIESDTPPTMQQRATRSQAMDTSSQSDISQHQTERRAPQ